MLQEKREKFKKLEIFLGKIFSKIGFSPNQYTIFGLFFSFVSFLFLIKVQFVPALFFFLTSAILDLIDGAVARFKNLVSKKGAFLDTIFDRYSEGIIFLGFLFLPLRDFILPAKIWIFLAFFGSLITTYAKAAAKEKELVEKEMKKGFFGRGERMILISLTIFLGIFEISLMIYPIILLAILTNLGAIQRIILALRNSF